LLHQNLRLEIEPGGKAEKLVRGPRIAIDAAVLAAAIGIDAGVETDVGTVVRGDDRARRIAQINRARRAPFLDVRLVIDDVLELPETILRFPARASSFPRRVEGHGISRIAVPVNSPARRARNASFAASSG